MENHHLYEFGPFRLDTAQKCLFYGDSPIALTPKAFDTLLVLVERSGRIIEKDELLKVVWNGAFVEEAIVAQNIFAIRRVLGHGYIETVPKRGYRFAAEVRVSDVDEVAADQSRTPGDEALDTRTATRVANGTSSLQHAAPPQCDTGQHAAVPVARSAAQRERKRTFAFAAGAVVLGLTAAVGWLVIARHPTPRSRPFVAKSIAVLPFTCIDASDQHELELGMADAVITRMSTLDQIVVSPTSSIFRYVGKSYDPLDAGRELKVEAIMQGTIQQSDDRVRVTVQLIDVSDGRPMWADHFDENRSNLLAIQDSISAQIAQALRLELTDNQREEISRHHTENIDAYRAYVKGVYSWNKRTEEALERSVEYFEQAISLDPNYALAYAGLADAATLLYERGVSRRGHTSRYPGSQYLEKGKAAAERALALQDSIPEAHIAMSLVFVYKGDSTAAEREQRRALKLAPNNATAHQRYAWILFNSGQLDRAAQEMERAVELEPLSVANHASRASFLYYSKRYDECLEECERILELDPGHRFAPYFEGLVHEQKGEYDRAIQEIQRSGQNGQSEQLLLEALGHVYGALGDKAKARDTIKRLAILAETNDRATYSLAVVCAGLGDTDRAFEWLERAKEATSMTPPTLPFDPRLSAIRSDPRYDALIASRGAIR